MVMMVVMMRMLIMIASRPAQTFHEAKLFGGHIGHRWTQGGFKGSRGELVISMVSKKILLR